MEIINVDKIYQPIKFVIEGKEYSVIEVTPGTMLKITELADKSKNPVDSAVKQFCLLTGEKEDVAYKIPMRKIRKVLQVITAKVLGTDESEKNESSGVIQKD